MFLLKISIFGFVFFLFPVWGGGHWAHNLEISAVCFGAILFDSAAALSCRRLQEFLTYFCPSFVRRTRESNYWVIGGKVFNLRVRSRSTQLPSVVTCMTCVSTVPWQQKKNQFCSSITYHHGNTVVGGPGLISISTVWYHGNMVLQHVAVSPALYIDSPVCHSIHYLPCQSLGLII